MDEQEKAVKQLRKEGFKECHRMKYTPFSDDGDEREIVVMKKKPTRFTTHYREVHPDGSIH